MKALRNCLLAVDGTTDEVAEDFIEKYVGDAWTTYYKLDGVVSNWLAMPAATFLQCMDNPDASSEEKRLARMASLNFMMVAYASPNCNTRDKAIRDANWQKDYDRNRENCPYFLFEQLYSTMFSRQKCCVLANIFVSIAKSNGVNEHVNKFYYTTPQPETITALALGVAIECAMKEGLDEVVKLHEERLEFLFEESERREVPFTEFDWMLMGVDKEEEQA